MGGNSQGQKHRATGKQNASHTMTRDTESKRRMDGETERQNNRPKDTQKEMETEQQRRQAGRQGDRVGGREGNTRMMYDSELHSDLLC